jgi:hypothetical protein
LSKAAVTARLVAAARIALDRETPFDWSGSPRNAPAIPYWRDPRRLQRVRSWDFMTLHDLLVAGSFTPLERDRP